MANEFVTAKEIAERALPHLVEQIKMLPLVQSGVYDEALTRHKGDTIQVRKPTRGEVVDGSIDITSNIQDVKDESVEITLSYQDTYPVQLSSKELTLNLDSMERQVIMPAVTKLAEKINSRLLLLYKDVPNYSGTSGTTPGTLASISQSRKVLQLNNAPKADRAYVFDPEAEAAYLELDSLVEVDKSGETAALRDAVIGRVMDILMVSDTMIEPHVAGGFTALTDVIITAGAEGAKTITLTSAAGTSTAQLLQGDLFTLDGVQYVVTADATAAAGVVSVGVYPALPKAFGDMDSVDVTFPDETAGGHVPNLMFQKDAFAIAMAPLESVDPAKSYTIDYEGFSIRVVEDYDIKIDKKIIRFDVLYGVKTTYPELALRVLG